MNAPAHQPISINIGPGTQAMGNVTLHSPVNVGHHSQLAHCAIGAFSYVGNFCEITCVEIGRYCQLSNHICFIYNHPLDRLTGHPASYADIFPPPYAGSAKRAFAGKTSVRVGNDVWIGHGAKITGGVTIGDGAVIGAGAIVTKDVPAYAIVVGIPARIIRYRFPPELVQRMQESQWWQYDITSADLNWESPEATLDSIEQLASTGSIRRHEWLYSYLSDPVSF